MRLRPQLLQHHAFSGNGSGSRDGIRTCWDSLRPHDGTNELAVRGKTFAARDQRMDTRGRLTTHSIDHGHTWIFLVILTPSPIVPTSLASVQFEVAAFLGERGIRK